MLLVAVLSGACGRIGFDACPIAAVDCVGDPGNACELDVDCAKGYLCVEGNCRLPDGNTCVSDFDCVGICNAGTCESPAGILSNEWGWTWENPYPTGQLLRDAWEAGPNDVWMVGLYGTIVHWDGSRFDHYAAGTHEALLAIFGFAANDVWAVGYGGTFLHWNGSAWTRTAIPVAGIVSGLWGASSADLWAVSSNGQAHHWDGTSWSSGMTSITDHLYGGVTGSAADDVWALGQDGALTQWTGSSWNTVTSPSIAQTSRVAMLGSDVLFANGASLFTYSGGAWTTQNGPGGVINDIFAESPTNVWTVGSTGMHHFDGGSWTPAPLPIAQPTLSRYRSLSDGRRLSVGRAVVLHDTAWRALSYGSRQPVYAAATVDGVLWAVGAAGTVLRRDSSYWKPVDSGATVTLNDVSGAADGSGWIVGSGGTFLRWNGSAWQATPSGISADLRGVWAHNARDAWAVGMGGTLVHWDGVSWKAVASPTTVDLNAVWGLGADDVWAVGQTGVIVHFDGERWQQSSSGTTDDLNAVCGVSPTSVWAVGGTTDTARAIRWNGAAWIENAQFTAGTGHKALTDALCLGQDDVVAVGYQRVYQVGATQSSALVGMPSGVRFITGDATNLWIGGAEGAVLRAPR
ncbi:MAG TPA: hypothetical protein VIV11_43205 [Kofleriaceae bacterium]